MGNRFYKLARKCGIALYKHKYKSQNHCVFSRKAEIDTVSAIGQRCQVYGKVIDSVIDDYVGIYGIIRNCLVGSYSYIAEGTLENAQVGRFCSIGRNVSVVRGQHPSRKWATTSPSFYSSMPANGISFLNSNENNQFEEYKWIDKARRIAVAIGNDVWIGNDVSLMEGIKIGDGAIIGTGAVVVDNVPPYGIVGGVPAKLIRKRFEEEQIEHLLRLQWWNWSADLIRERAHYFSDVEQLLSVIDM